MYARVYATHNLNEVAVSYIKDRILSGELKSGDKIVESEVSEALGISRAPVREGLRELNASGLLTYSRRRGSHVLEMSLEELQETFEIRISLELQILNILIKQRRLGDEDFSRLALLNEKLASFEGKAMNRQEKMYNLSYLDISFHRYLWRASGSHRRYQLLDGLFFQLLTTMNQDAVTLGTFREKALEHEKITAALRKNSDAVFIEFQNHLKRYMTAVIPGTEPLDIVVLHSPD